MPKNPAKQLLKQKYLRYHQHRYPNFPDVGRSYPGWYNQSFKSTKALTKAVVNFLRLSGHQAERINNQGQARIETIKHASGYDRKKISWTKGTGQPGTADISCVINGKSIKIEIKNSATGDQMSATQKRYRDIIEATGGVYYIARDFDSFINWYNENYSEIPNMDLIVMMMSKPEKAEPKRRKSKKQENELNFL